jgi:hypothetical protein
LCSEIPTPAESLAAGGIAFVGEVVATRNLDRWATVRVREIWSDDLLLPEFVEVRGASSGPEGFLDIYVNVGSTDRSYKSGTVYLFFPHLDDDRQLSESICTATQPLTAGLRSLRPPTAHPPLAGGAMAAEGAGAWPIAAVVMALVAAAGIVLLRRPWRGRSRRHPRLH